MAQAFQMDFNVGFNVDKLEGAVMHMVQCCGCLSDAALDEYAVKYALIRGKELSPTYASDRLLPRLVRSYKIYRTGEHFYSIHPLIYFKRDKEDAFWVYMENMENVDPKSTICGPAPAQLTYIKNGAIYHIIRAHGDGIDEQGLAVQLEIAVEQRLRKERRKQTAEPIGTGEKFIFIFASHEFADQARFKMKSPCLFCVITYDNERLRPSLDFFVPE